MHGGWGSYQYGGAGTVYIESHYVNPPYRHLITDNGGYTTNNRIAEVERLNLTGNYFSTTSSPELMFRTHSGINITTDALPHAIHQHTTYYSPVYSLSHLFSDGEANVNQFYMAAAATAQLTIDLPYETYVEYLRIYPYCNTLYTAK